MDLTPELLGGAAVGVVVILSAVGNYLRSKAGTPATPPTVQLAHAEMVIQLRRIADRVEKAADLSDLVASLVAALEKISSTLGPELAKSAEAQRQIASKREAELREMISEMSDRMERMETPRQRRRT